MSNGDKNYQHMVVIEVPITDELVLRAVCHTEGGQPAVFNDSPPAELLAAQLREKNPAGIYRVIGFQVL